MVLKELYCLNRYLGIFLNNKNLALSERDRVNNFNCTNSFLQLSPFPYILEYK